MSTNISSLHMTPADPDRHLMAISQITSDAFADGQYVEEISQQYIGNCHYDWDTSRLIWDGERLVHHWGVWGYPMRLESVRLNVAGIGAVFTEEPYRKQGLMEMAATDSIKAMRENGYDLSVLRGRHYVKYGYVRAWNYVTYRLTADDIPDIEIKLPYQLLTPKHVDEIDAVYNRQHEAFSGTCVRPTYHMLDADGMKAYGWFEDDGGLVGYVRAVTTDDKKTLQCLEAAGDPENCLAVMTELFTLGDYESLAFFTLPNHHPVLQILRRRACVVEDRYFHNTGWLVRIVNLESTLKKLLPLLERRLRHSHYSDWRGALQLDAGEQKSTLQFLEDGIQIAPGAPSRHSLHGGPEIVRFLIGSDDAREIIQQAGMTCTGEAVGLAEVLFPNLHPMMSHWDEY